MLCRLSQQLQCWLCVCVCQRGCVCGCIYMLTFHTSIRKYLQLYFFLCSPTCVYFCLVSILSFAQLAFYSFLFLTVSVSLFALLFACWQSEAFVCKLHAFALQLMYISGIQAVRAKSRVGKWEIEREKGRGGRHSCWICIAEAKQGELTWLQYLKLFF